MQRHGAVAASFRTRLHWSHVRLLCTQARSQLVSTPVLAAAWASSDASRARVGEADLTLRSGTNDYLAHINIGRLFDRECNGAGNRIR